MLFCVSFLLSSTYRISFDSRRKGKNVCTFLKKEYRNKRYVRALYLANGMCVCVIHTRMKSRREKKKKIAKIKARYLRRGCRRFRSRGKEREREPSGGKMQIIIIDSKKKKKKKKEERDVGEGIWKLIWSEQPHKILLNDVMRQS